MSTLNTRAAFRLLISITLVSLNSLVAKQVGSNVAISREERQLFLASESDNKIFGYVFMEHGFELEENATCTYDGLLTVAGDFSNHGTLVLEHDLIFSNIATCTNCGDIVGNGHEIRFASATTALGSAADATIHTWQDCSVFFNSSLTLYGSLKFGGTSCIDGNGNTLSLANTAALYVDAGSTLIVRDCIIDGVTMGKISCIAADSHLVLDNVHIIQTGDYAFDQGSLEVTNHVKISGAQRFIYSSSETSTINSFAKLDLDFETTFSYDPSNGSSTALEFTDGTGSIIFDGATLHAVNGITLCKGKLVIKNNSQFLSDYSTLSGGITLGDGVTADNDCKVVILSDLSLTVLSGALNYNNVAASSLELSNNKSVLCIGSNTVLRILQPINLGQGCLKLLNGATVGRDSTSDLIGSVVPLGVVYYVPTSY